MYRLGIDIGSTYTKYCLMQDNDVVDLWSEKTRVFQKSYFDEILTEWNKRYPEIEVISCGYGRKNVDGIKQVNELSALAKGVCHLIGESAVVLDIGGQDTKIIVQEKGALKEFFINDKCAAGSGMFLINTLNLLDMSFENIHLMEDADKIKLSSTCAVFAQSGIVELIADNVSKDDIVTAVIKHILIKSKPLLGKVQTDRIILSGGLSNIRGIAEMAEKVLGCRCDVMKDGMYMAAMGCALL